ncbi:TnsA endonuclease N-terminal domain-containing protein [Rummeliibacillus suwonensis]|uniref:TnsA endonuclease N-terminal domain-containing protein n=1 Tax=Rummeliibacillus suwonensis TaxID=1306154 RepID=UPI002897FA5D|nr:WYL domain-containing protein [Rummeliibacillus suwonensis]
MKDAIIKMISEKRLLKIIYDNEERRIEPYYLFIYRNSKYQSLYVIGYCHLRKSPRIFKVSRIHSRRQLRDVWTLQPFSLSKVDLSRFERSRIKFISYPQEMTNQILMAGYSIQDNLEKRIYPKTIQLSKMDDPGVCRSPLEERVIQEYNNNSNVENILVEPFKIKYSVKNEKKNYIPDLLIIYKNGFKELVGIKLSSEISEFQNQQKFIAATKYAKDNNMKFIIRGMDIKGSNYRKTGEFGWNKQTGNHQIQNFNIDYKFVNKVDSYEFVESQFYNNTTKTTNKKIML